MTQVCSICNHPKRLEIDREIISGRSLATLSRKYDVSWDSLNNHKNKHISYQLSQAMQKKDLQNSFDLLGKIDQILTKAEMIFDRNFQKGRDGLAIKALSEQRNTIDLLAKISWMLHEARLTELEQARIESGQAQREDQEARERKLKVLNDAELDMLLALHQKIENQSKETIVQEKPFFMPDYRPSKQYHHKPSKGEERPEENRNKGDFGATKPRRTKFPS